MLSHILNIFLLVLLPMVVINVKGADFSLSNKQKLGFFLCVLTLKLLNSGCYSCVLYIFNFVPQIVVLRSSQSVVQKQKKIR